MSAHGEDHADAVVIGSGPNGLAAAIRLAEHGRSVVVLEAQNRAGGAVATDSLTLPGFRHDTFSAVYPTAAASPVFGRLPLARFGLRWLQPPVAMAHPLPDGRAVALYRDVDRTATSLDALAPGDGARWQEMMRPYLQHFAALQATIMGGFPPLRGGIRLLAALGLTGSLELARLAMLPATALAEELFHGEGARAWLFGSCLHGDVPPWEAGSAVTGFYLHLLGHTAGWPSPEGGAGRLAEALAGYLRSLGGEIRLGAPAERVLAGNNRRLQGVQVKGDVLRTGMVIADVMPRELLRLGGEALEPAYRRRLERYRYGPQIVKVDWALSGPIPWTAPEAREAGTVHVGGPPGAIEDAVRARQAGNLPERPFMLLGQQSLADPSRAPAGKHTVWAYTRVPADVDWAEQWQRLVEHMEAQVDRFAPGFRDRILARHVLLPDDLERRNRNLVGGDVGGGSYRLDQLLFRPLPALWPYRTPLRGLYLGSAATYPGGGVHGACGDAAARLALLESRVRRFW